MFKPSLPQGMRDFPAEILRKREYIIRTIRGVFELYGFQPLETPAMENLETLMGKYGEEGDRLIFKVLNNGLSDPKNADKAKAAFDLLMQGKNTKDLTERALKYDLTIPFARFVAMNQASLTMPFKRYQVQPVWRADRPQKGRYREFTQCDADVVGSKSLMNELELLNIYRDVFDQLEFPDYTISLNSRKILAALADKCGGMHLLPLIAVAIDKLDKIGMDKVLEELAAKGLNGHQADIVQSYLQVSGSNEEKLSRLNELLGSDEQGKGGIEDLRFILARSGGKNVSIDPTLARGLDYYTGIIFEVKPPASVHMGSIGGGGRYDDLTGLFGVPGIPGVGISFGIDRIFDVMEELDLFPKDMTVGVTALFFNLGEKESETAYKCIQELRSHNISCELFHEQAKMDKQFKYAEKKKIRFVVIIGSNELQSNSAVVKELSTGKQETVDINKLQKYFN